MTSDKPTQAARAALDRVERVLREHPEIKERTGRYLAGDLKGGPMTEMRTVTLRLPEDLVKRAEALAPALKADPEAATWGGRVPWTAILRRAVIRGLAALEAEHGRARKRKPKGRR